MSHPSSSSHDSPVEPSAPGVGLQIPLYLQILIGVTLGGIVGGVFGKDAIGFGWTTVHLGEIAALYIRLLSALATPLIFFAIVEAFIHTAITPRHGLTMVAVCALNIAVAFAIGLTLLNVFQPGKMLPDSLEQLAAKVTATSREANSSSELRGKAAQQSLSPLKLIGGYVPTSVVQPFTENKVLTVAALAILVGAALRTLKARNEESLAGAIATFDACVIALYQIILVLLDWMIHLAPIAAALAVAGVVGSIGRDIFQFMIVFLVLVVGALALHSLVYYPLSAWWIGGVSPRKYFGHGLEAILTGFSMNSSLATAPITLTALKQMQVSDTSARLSCCVGTNFNNDGITLYEALTALFIAQALGMDSSMSYQVNVLIAALAGSMGIAGIPNSGFIILTLVLQASGLSPEMIDIALPIAWSVDFINARLRSAVNVMGDMQVAILLDAWLPRSTTATDSP